MGHGSRFIADTAIERLIGVSNKALEYRTAQEQQLGYGWANGAAGCKHCEAKKLGDVTSLNLTMLQAGVTPDNGQTFNLNVIPASARAGFDIRIATDTPPAVRTEAWFRLYMTCRKLVACWSLLETQRLVVGAGHRGDAGRVVRG